MTTNIPANAIEAHSLLFTLTLVRVAAFLAMFPMFAGKNLPRLVKVGLAVVLASMWYSNVELHGSFNLAAAHSEHWPIYLALAGREMLVGAVFGYAFGLFLLPARIAGSYIGQEMGFTLGAIADPSSQGSGNVMTLFFDALSTLIFLSLDLHRTMFLTLHATFLKFPVGSWALPTMISGLPADLSRAHTWGMMIAAPIAACLFLNLVVLAVLMKVSPQLNLFSVGMTLRLAVGLVATTAFLPEVAAITAHAYSQAAMYVSMGVR